MSAEPFVVVPPQNLDAEEHVLGACMLSPNAIAAVAEIVKPAHFYRASHGRIYEVILSMFSLGRPVDAITLCDELDSRGLLEDVGGRTRMNELAALVPATSNAARYATIISEAATLRGMVRVGQEIARLGMERGDEVPVLLDQAETLMFELSTDREHGDFTTLGASLKDAFEKLAELHEGGREIIGLPSGFPDLDRLTSGFQPGNLLVLAARPSMGKSGLMLDICRHAAVKEDVPVALFTLEMSRSEITQRILSAEGRVESQKLRNGRLDTLEWTRITDAANRLEKAPLYVDDSGAITLMEIRSKARRLKAREPRLGLVAVDYLQLMTSGTSAENRVQEVSQISRSLKVLARELDVPVLALSQLSRSPEHRHDKRPILSDLRESGSIEQDADLVMFIYRDEYYNPEDTEAGGIAEVHLAKHRNGPTETVKLAFIRRLASFATLADPSRTAGA